jgi:hypothetical protein
VTRRWPPGAAGWPGRAASEVWDDLDGEWLTIDDCAKRMRITPERLLQLVKRRALRTRHDYGVTLVQPAIISGAVD